jgi:hypothetical protein
MTGLVRRESESLLCGDAGVEAGGMAVVARGEDFGLSMLAAAVASVAGLCSSFNLRPIEAMGACLDAAAKA